MWSNYELWFSDLRFEINYELWLRVVIIDNGEQELLFSLINKESYEGYQLIKIMIKIGLVMELNEDDGMMDDVIEDGDVIMLLS